MARREAQEWLKWLETMAHINALPDSAEGVAEAFALVESSLPMAGRRHQDLARPVLEVEHGFGGPLVMAHVDVAESIAPYRVEGESVFGVAHYGGLASLLWAISLIPETVPFHLLVTSDEVEGGAVSRDLVLSRAKQSPVVLVTEPGQMDGGIIMTRAGSGVFHLTIRSDDGSRAITELSRQVLWLGQLGQLTLGTTVEVNEVQAIARSLSASAQITIRAWTDEEVERVQEALNFPPVYESGTEVEYRGGFSRPPMSLGRGAQRWWERAEQIWEELTGSALAGGRSETDSAANFTAPWAPTLDGMGPWSPPDAEEEEIWWPSIQLRAQLIQRLLEEAAASS